jgi:hypothetical protein
MPETPTPRSNSAHTDPYGLGAVHSGEYIPGEGLSSHSDAKPTSTGRNDNRAALLSLIFGILAAGFTVVSFLPGSSTYWVSGSGAIALLWGVIAIAYRATGRSTNIWAPIVGILLGGAATTLMLAGVAVLGILSSATGGLLPTSSTTANAQPAPPAYSSEPFVFAANPDLTADGSVVQQLATAMNQKYASGNASLGGGQSWPAAVKFTPTQVLADDGSVLATIPAGHILSYSLSPDKKRYTLTVTGANRSEIASYTSGLDKFSFTCAPADTNCVPAP